MHYTMIDGEFVYASEIKSILEHPKFVKRFNKRALDTYLSYQYAVPPETFFEGVFCLMPGHYLWYKDGEVETTRYWEARFNPNEELTEEEAVNSIEKVFENYRCFDKRYIYYDSNFVARLNTKVLKHIFFHHFDNCFCKLNIAITTIKEILIQFAIFEYKITDVVSRICYG